MVSVHLSHTTPLVITFTLLLSICSSNAQRPDFSPPPWAKGKFHAVATDSPMLHHMMQFPDFQTSSLFLQTHVHNTESAVRSFLRSQSSPNSTQRFEACNVPEEPFGPAVRFIFGLRGWPDPDVACVTDVIDGILFTDHAPDVSIRELRKAFHIRGRLIDSQRPTLAQSLLFKWRGRALLSNWSRTFVFEPVPRTRRAIRCTIGNVGAIRVDRLWYMALSITNAPAYFNLELNQRQFLGEFVHVEASGEQAYALNQISKIYNESANGNDEKSRNCTTVFSRSRGSIQPSSFTSIYPEQNPALQASMTKAEHNVQQATDALTLSNLSILFLPVLLNLIPISLLSEVKTRLLLMYMVMTDILTVVPLATKGVELIVIGMNDHLSTVTRVTTSLTGEQGAGGAAEFWVAECSAKDNVKSIGVMFVCLALFFMVVGVTAEIMARRFMARRKYERDIMKQNNWIGGDEHYDDESYMTSLGGSKRTRLLAS